MQLVGHNGILLLNGKFTLAQPLPHRRGSGGYRRTRFTSRSGPSPPCAALDGGWSGKVGRSRLRFNRRGKSIFHLGPLQIPFQPFIAAKVENATNAIRELGENCSLRSTPNCNSPCRVRFNWRPTLLECRHCHGGELAQNSEEPEHLEWRWSPSASAQNCDTSTIAITGPPGI